jgi:hypothetical protein
MKKILRLVTTSVLTLTLVACGEASTSSSVSSGTTSSPGTVSSAYANVTSVTLSAASNLLTQVIGSQKTVTVTAVLNANTNPMIQLEWFVNGVKQTQTGRTLDFTPTSVGTFAITARTGNVVSNALTLTATQPTLTVTSAAFVNAGQIEVAAEAGARVSVVGASLKTSSYYDMTRGVYVLNLVNTVTQGTSVTVRMEKEGLATVTRNVSFDTRKLTLTNFFTYLDDDTDLDSEYVLNATNEFTVVRPFNENNPVNYTMELRADEIGLPGTPSETFSLKTTVPTGAAAIVDELYTSNEQLIDKTFEVNNETTLGKYTHVISYGPKTITVVVNVVAPEENKLTLLNVQQPLDEWFDDEHASVFEQLENKDFVVTYDFYDYSEFTSEQLSSEGVIDVLTPGSDGFFTIVKPFATETNLTLFEFVFLAENFEKPEFIDNVVNMSLTGPVEDIGVLPLFTGIATKDPDAAIFNEEILSFYSSFINFADWWEGRDDVTSEDYADSLGYFEFENSDYDDVVGDGIAGEEFSTLPGRDEENYVVGAVRQLIDSGTPAGEYTFTVQAGLLGSQETLTVKLRVVEPTPSIELVLNGYVNTEEVGEVRTLSVAINGNTLTVEKPLIPGSINGLDFLITLTNWQNREATIDEITSDALLPADSDDQKTFESDGTETPDFSADGAFLTPDYLDYEDGVTYRYSNVRVTMTGLGINESYNEDQVLLRGELGDTDKDDLESRSEEDYEFAFILEEFSNKIVLFGNAAADTELGFSAPNSLNKIRSITSDSLTGSVILTVAVDGLTQTFRINIVEPQPKLFLMETDSDFDYDFESVDSDLELIEDSESIESTTSGTTLRFNVYASQIDGDYDLFDDIENYVAVADLKAGNYNWSVERTYPNGETYRANDVINLTADSILENGLIDYVGLLSSGVLLESKFAENFWLHNAKFTDSYSVGMHRYTFRIANMTKVIEINVLPDPIIEINYVEIGRHLLLPVPGFTNLFIADLTGFNLSDSQVVIGFTAKNFREDLEFELYDGNLNPVDDSLEIQNGELTIDGFTGFYTEFSKNQIQRSFLGRVVYFDNESFDTIADIGETITFHLNAVDRDDVEGVDVYSWFRVILVNNSLESIDNIYPGISD